MTLAFYPNHEFFRIESVTMTPLGKEEFISLSVLTIASDVGDNQSAFLRNTASKLEN